MNGYPESPVQMYYCTLDEQVFYENALVAEAWMNDNGASAVTVNDGGPLNHGGCALLAILGVPFGSTTKLTSAKHRVWRALGGET